MASYVSFLVQRLHIVDGVWVVILASVWMVTLHSHRVAGYQNSLRVLYSQGHNPTSCKKSIRHIPQVPERILDAPQILDDYCK